MSNTHTRTTAPKKNIYQTQNIHLRTKCIRHTLTIRQQPAHARVCTIPERDRRPIDPPPILRMSLDGLDPEEEQYHTQSPHYFMCANLVHPHDHTNLYLPVQNYLTGTIVSSLHRLKDIDNSDGAFFVFGDLAVKEEGEFRLLFSLFEIIDTVVRTRKTILSDIFTVYAPRHFPGPLPSTFLSRSFSDQGVRMRIRKEHRIQVSSPRKRKQPETEKPSGKRRLQSSPLSDDSPSETSVNIEDRKVEFEKPLIAQRDQQPPAREYQREQPSSNEYKSEPSWEIQPKEYPERPREYAVPGDQPPRAPEYQREPPQRTDYAAAAYPRGEQPPHYRVSPPIPQSQTPLPDISALPIPIRSTSPMNISIHREPITAFPLFHQVMPDIAQYHLGASKPNTPPEASGGDYLPNRRQEPCRPGQEYPVDSPFDSRHMNPPTHPLFP
ncbi:hypothetical protein INT44_007032 [Umbelopsis vinacea]|uniref:Velvet domain-containing protein n=1 Tax=Umbelopsis vinacea TaxID=44442 RepID=A0A8H7PG70_9FUNG|nr:hypothetical protein INT44_007032 [Umbelopsis vinacea]